MNRLVVVVCLAVVMAAAVIAYSFIDSSAQESGGSPRVNTVSIVTSLDDHKALAESLRAAKSVELYEGLPHQYAEPQLLQDELEAKPTITIGEFPFYAKSLKLVADDVAKLTELFCNVDSFEPMDLTADKACGGFHPDYCLVWHFGSSTYHALLCFGCSEVKAAGGKLKLHCDIRRTAHDEFQNTLGPYRKNRPTPKL